MTTQEVTQPPTYNERQACFVPAEPVTFKPASLLIRAELADLMAHPPGAAAHMTVADLLREAQPMADFPNDFTQAEVADMLSTLCRTLDEVNGLVR